MNATTDFAPTAHVRTRYAPSPTGEQHIGGVRTALYNYLFARANNGAFVVRIEDTDRARLKPGSASRILATLEWAGIVADESPAIGGQYAPYTQSERLPLYREHAEQLVSTHAAYWAYDTEQELAELRRLGRGYDGRGRMRTAEENNERRRAGVGGVIRMITPSDGASGWEDMILGWVSHKHADIPRDPVLFKSDGYPTYHLANVVDDHAMQITHVLRAQEWLSSTPLHLLLYRALKWELPRYAHLPLIVGENGKKLSKRHGATSVDELRLQGFSAQGVCNYLALLGWSLDGSREHFTLRELEQSFTIERVQKSAATFDWQKLQWHNAHYLRQMESSELVRTVAAFDSDHAHADALLSLINTPRHADAIAMLADALKERIHTVSEAAPWLDYLGVLPPPNAALLHGKKLTASQAAAVLQYLTTLDDAELISVNTTEQRLRDYCQENGLPFGHSMGAVRAALAAAKSSLPARVMLATLPVDTIRDRLTSAQQALMGRAKK